MYQNTLIKIMAELERKNKLSLLLAEQLQSEYYKGKVIAYQDALKLLINNESK